MQRLCHPSAGAVRRSFAGASFDRRILTAARKRQIRNGKLAAIKIDHRTLISAEALRAWLAALPPMRCPAIQTSWLWHRPLRQPRQMKET
jgi:hypothetical protein